MVLQQTPAKAQVWGFADSGSSVTITMDGEQVAQATVGSDGKWSAKLPATASGGPHTIEATAGGSTARISDVLFGDVWFCGGQSNMVVEFEDVSCSLN